MMTPLTGKRMPLLIALQSGDEQGEKRLYCAISQRCRQYALSVARNPKMP